MIFPIFGASDDDPATSTLYIPWSSAFGVDWGLENRRQAPLSEAITLTDLRVQLSVAPGVGNSRTYTVRKNGADTAATLTISGASTTGSYAGSVSFAAGDLVCLQHTASGTPAALGNSYWGVMLQTTGNKALLMGACATASPTSGTNYVNVFSGVGTTTTSGDQDVVVPTGGNITKLAVATPEGSPGAGKSYAISVRVNNTTDALTATISDAATSASATGSQALAAGDTIQIKDVPSGTPTARRFGWCVTFEPTNSGETFCGFGSATNLSTTTTQYEQPTGGGGGWSATSTARLVHMLGATIKNLYVRLSAAPGGVTSRTFTWRDNLADTSLAVTITGAATTGNDTSGAHAVAHTIDTDATLKSTLSGSPAAANAHVGYVILTDQTLILETTGTASGSATATGTATATGATTGTASGSATATATATAAALTTGSATGSATVAGIAGGVIGTTGSAAGAGSGSGAAAIVLPTTGTVTIGGGRKVIHVFDD